MSSLGEITSLLCTGLSSMEVLRCVRERANNAKKLSLISVYPLDH